MSLSDRDHKLGSLSERLKFLVDTAGIKQVHLASKLGITPQAINHLCNSNTQSSKYTKKIATILKANEKWLEHGQGSPFSEISRESSDNSICNVPVYYFDQFKKLTDKKDISSLNSVEQHTSVTLSQNTFGLYIPYNTFAPKFEKGDIVFLDPNAEIHNGMFGLVYSNEIKELVFCYFYANSSKNLLCGFIPSDEVSIFLIDENDIVYGVYRELFKKA